ncbi:MAG: cobalt-precorrin-5B (C(1))-methyltransferase [Lachnospira pectinoschiza]
MTNGILIYASVYIERTAHKRVVTDGGTGVGRITKKGLSPGRRSGN